MKPSMRCLAAASITGGTSTPKRSRLVDQELVDGAGRRSISVSLTRSWTSAREAAEHFWPAKPNALLTERGDDVVEIGVGVDDHAVLAAHLGHDALEAALAGGELGGRAR